MIRWARSEGEQTKVPMKPLSRNPLWRTLSQVQRKSKVAVVCSLDACTRCLLVGIANNLDRRRQSADDVHNEEDEYESFCGREAQEDFFGADKRC